MLPTQALRPPSISLSKRVAVFQGLVPWVQGCESFFCRLSRKIPNARGFTLWYTNVKSDVLFSALVVCLLLAGVRSD